MNLMHRIFLKLQDAYISLNSLLSPSMIHNFEKHDAIKKYLFYKHIEGVKGDYLEFGVYEGTSLKGAASYWRNISRDKINFYGFDSFEGMDPKKGDEHPFYTTFDFSTSFKVIKKRFSSLPEVKLIKGFFESTLKGGPERYGIKKAAVVMIDCDLYSSAKEVFSFLKSVVDKGTIIILDDYFNYKADKKKGVRAAFEEFLKDGFRCQEIGKYGIGGAIFIINDIKRR